MSVRQVVFQHPLVAQRHLLIKLLLLPFLSKVYALSAKPGMDLFHKAAPVCSFLIHLIDKQEGWDSISFQEPPQRLCMSLNAVRAADQ